MRGFRRSRPAALKIIPHPPRSPLRSGEATLFQKISREYTKQTGMEIKAVLLRTGPVRVAFFRCPDGELIELLEDKTGYT